MIRLANTRVILLCMALHAILVSGRPMTGEGVERSAARVSDVFNDVDEDYYRWAQDGIPEGLRAHPTQDLYPSRSTQREMLDPPHMTRPESHGGRASYTGQRPRQPGWSQPFQRSQDLGQQAAEPRRRKNPSNSHAQPDQSVPRSNSRALRYTPDYASKKSARYDQRTAPLVQSRFPTAEASSSHRAPVPGSEGATLSWRGNSGGSSWTGGAAGGSSSTTPRFRRPDTTASAASSSSAVRVAQPEEQIRIPIEGLDLPPGFDDVAAMPNDEFVAKIKKLTKAELLRVAFELFRARTTKPSIGERVQVQHYTNGRESRSLGYVYATSKQESVFLEIVKRMINAKKTHEIFAATLTIDSKRDQAVPYSFLAERVGNYQTYPGPEHPPFYGGKHQLPRLYPFVLGDYEVFISSRRHTLDVRNGEVLYSAFALPKGVVASGSLQANRSKNPATPAYGIMFGYLKFRRGVTETFLFKEDGTFVSVPRPAGSNHRPKTSKQRIAKKLRINK